MTATLHSIQDARSPINKMSKKELLHLARYEQRLDVDIFRDMPGELIRRKFMQAPPSRMPRPLRATLGAQKRLVIPPYHRWVEVAFAEKSEPREEDVVETDSLSELERQWEAERQQKTDFSELPFVKLKQECARRGIKFRRTDKKHQLIEKLNGYAA